MDGGYVAQSSAHGASDRRSGAVRIRSARYLGGFEAGWWVCAARRRFAPPSDRHHALAAGRRRGDRSELPEARIGLPPARTRSVMSRETASTSVGAPRASRIALPRPFITTHSPCLWRAHTAEANARARQPSAPTRQGRRSARCALRAPAGSRVRRAGGGVQAAPTSRRAGDARPLGAWAVGCARAGVSGWRAPVATR
jgi:hypothetical protein